MLQRTLPCSSSNDGSGSGSINNKHFETPPIDVTSAYIQQKLNISDHLHVKNPVFCSGNNQSPSKSTSNKSDETRICKEIITKKLHHAIKSFNKLAFPNISNQNRLIEELLDIKEQYSFRTMLSNSDNCESSQSTVGKESFKNLKVDFKLNPILTQESPVLKDIGNMFPNAEYSSSVSDSDTSSDLIYNEPVPLLQNHVITNFNDSKPSTSSSARGDSITFIRSSPISSSGSPVWMPNLSPVKFIPRFPPTPKLYYRQKMF
ncbi:uncharacterized protein CEXT_583281 [Caerostris extrusa]|uniref:Uncharacterized protein n=1 Tax=Caerostris extrusa TaxID=172846 RepID=A0AAV4QAV7_CAEEX|nr:uncharacterized protein CEXT_583281 [Caerostris extrusa]